MTTEEKISLLEDLFHADVTLNIQHAIRQIKGLMKVLSTKQITYFVQWQI